LNWSYIIAAAIGAIPGIIAAWYAKGAHTTSKAVDLKVNGNVSRLLDVLTSAAIEIPHDVAAKVVSAPPINTPSDEATKALNSDEIMSDAFAAKLGHQ
jgi:hypothetical protein